MSFNLRVPVRSGVLVAALFLGACDNPYIQQLRQEFGWTEARMVSDGWLEGRRIPTAPLYCYDTLAEPDCFATAQERREDQLINRQKETPVPDY